MAKCGITLPDLHASGDNLYGPRICWQAFVDWAWDAFDFDRGDWDEGFGYESACDNRLPLSRTLSGIWCLTYSSPNFPRESYDSNILEWGCRFARNAIDELDGRCWYGDGPDPSGSVYALTQTGGLFVDNWTRLYAPYFYENQVSLRGGTLIHEARHADGKGHDSGNKDSSWDYNGAWRWHACWLAWFAVDGVSTSTAMKEVARQKTNNILNDKFDEPPGFNL